MKTSLKQMLYIAVTAALVAVATLFLHIPIPMQAGFCNLGDGVILGAGALIGPYAALAGAVGSALSDLILGFGLYAPATAVIKGLIGAISGILCAQAVKPARRAVYMVAAECWMVAGYFLFETLLYGASVAVTSLPGNGFQAAASVVVGMLLWPLLNRVKKIIA